MTTTTAATASSVAAIARLTKARKMIAPAEARHGGSTFHMNMFSIVNVAFDVAVMRLVSTAGIRSEKKLGECRVR